MRILAVLPAGRFMAGSKANDEATLPGNRRHASCKKLFSEPGPDRYHVAVPYREMGRDASPGLALRRLADRGIKRSERGDRPKEPPLRLIGNVRLPFLVSEDPQHPVDEQPGMTNTLVIHVHTEPFFATEIPLVRRATWAIHPLFDVVAYRTRSRWMPSWKVDATELVEQLEIEVPASKIARPTIWIHMVIEEVLTVVHGVFPVRRVQFGRESKH
jgi:hypothetical protein